MNHIEKIIAGAESASPEEQIKILDELDSRGIFMCHHENWETFVKRVSLLLQALREFDKGNIPEPLPKIINFSHKISEQLLDGANELIREKYKFTLPWTPCFFSRKATGCFSAGVQFQVDEFLPLIFLQDAFAHKENHLGYNRREVLAHELTHAARMFFPDSRYEEYFACLFYSSAFRQAAGGFFRVLPMVAGGMGLFAGVLSLVSGIYWGELFFTVPLYFLYRELKRILQLKKAREKLLQLHLDPLPVLVRLSDSEISLLAKLSVDTWMKTAENSIRWKLFSRKFHL